MNPNTSAYTCYLFMLSHLKIVYLCEKYGISFTHLQYIGDY